MSKTTLNTVSSGYNLQVINDNFAKIEDALENGVLWRDNPVGEPNQLESNIDANSKRIYNLPAPESNTDAARIQDVNNALELAVGTGDAVALASDLANNVDGSKGASKVGFNYSLTYLAGTIGKWLKDLALSTGAGFIGWIQAGAAAVLRQVQDKLRDTVSVFDFMTVAQIADVRAGTLLLDVTTAVQAALYSGAKKVIFPFGAYKVGALTLPNWIHLVGETMPQGIGGGDGPVRLVFNLAAGIGLTCGANPVLENITFKNAAGTYTDATATLSGTTAVAIKTNGDLQHNNCNFYYWYACVQPAGGCYYLRAHNNEFARCTIGYLCDQMAPYDMHISAPTSRLVETFITGSATYLPRNVKVFGGSIEGYSKVAQYFSEISFFGTYFETVVARDGCVAIDPLANGASVSLYGCLGYLNYTARFVNLSGLSGCMLTSSGNVWDGVGRAAGYVFFLPSSGTVRLMGDRFGSGHPNDCRYVSSLTFSGAQVIDFPSLPAGNVQAGYSGVTYFGGRGFSMNALTAAPSGPVSGMMVMAEGTAWDPLTRAAGRPYWVIWQGDRWRTPGGLA